jgi:hypothetical protein
MKKQIVIPGVLFVVLLAVIGSCAKSSNSSSSQSQQVVYKGALVGSTGYLIVNLQGSGLNGTNKSYILVTYIDSSQNPVKTIKDSLTTSSLNSWQPGKAIANVIFGGSSGITVTLISVDADGNNPVTSMSVPNDPYVKSFISEETVSNSPLLVFIGKAVPAASGCGCNTKTINFVVNPAYVGNSSAAANAIYIDSLTHWGGFLNAQILSSNSNQLTQIINNNDTAGLHVNNGPGGPNSNNASGPVTGTLQISPDGTTLSGTISGMYNPSYNTSNNCPCTYNITAVKVQ